MKERAAEVSKGKLLSQDVCLAFERECRRKAVLRVREDERGEADRAVSLVENGLVEVEALFVELMTFCSGDLERAGWVRAEISSTALRWPKMAA